MLDRCSGLPLLSFKAGETILDDGGRKGVLYILASGSVEIVKDGTQINVVSEPGAFLGGALTLTILHSGRGESALIASAFVALLSASAFMAVLRAIAESRKRLTRI